MLLLLLTYPGVTIHILCTKVKKILGLLYRTFYHDASVTSLLKLYVSLIQPNLEYACQVWSPHLVNDVEKLEGPKICIKALCETVRLGLCFLAIHLRSSYTRCSPKILQPLYNVQDCKSTDLLSFKYVFSQSHSFPAIFKPSLLSAILSDKLIFILICSMQTLVLSGIRCLSL